MSLSESFNQIPLMNKIIGGAAALVGVAGIGAVLATGGGVGFVVVILAILLLCVAVWFAFMLIANQLKAKRARQMEEDLVSGAGVDMGGAEADERALDEELREKWLEGYNRFKKYGLDVYEIPWLMMVGPPGCGKTTLLKKSQVVDPDECPGPGGTLGMNWMFTDQAVFLDLAGAVFMEQRKAGRWEKFLDFLGKHRENCPINGAILAVSYDNLSDDPETVHELATAVKRQLERLRDKLDVRFPVWVVVTKCDKIPGFREFFADADSLGAGKQMLGWSKPGDVDDLDESFVPAELDDHLETVFAQLRRMRMRKMRAMVGGDETGQRQSDRVDELFGLPDEIRKLTPALRRYLELIFITRKGRGAPPFLRGVYFSSSEQKGAALSEAAKRLGVKPRPSMVKDKAFFLYDLLKNKVFCEVGLVTRSNNVAAANRKKKILRYGIGTAAAVLITLILIVGFWSFTRAISNPAGNLHALSERLASEPQAGVDTVLSIWKPGAEPVYNGTEEVQGYRKVDILKDLRGGAEEAGGGFSPLMLIAFWQDHKGLRPKGQADRQALYAQVATRTLIKPMVERAQSRVLGKTGADNWQRVQGPDLVRMDYQLATLLQLATQAPSASSKDGSKKSGAKDGGKDAPAEEAGQSPVFTWRALDARYPLKASDKPEPAVKEEFAALAQLLDDEAKAGSAAGQSPPMPPFLSLDKVQKELKAVEALPDVASLRAGLDSFIGSLERELTTPSGDFGVIYNAAAEMQAAENELAKLNLPENPIQTRERFRTDRDLAIEQVSRWQAAHQKVAKLNPNPVALSADIKRLQADFLASLSARAALLSKQVQAAEAGAVKDLEVQQAKLATFADRQKLEGSFGEAAKKKWGAEFAMMLDARLKAASGITRLKLVLDTVKAADSKTTSRDRIASFKQFDAAVASAGLAGAESSSEKLADAWAKLSKQYLLVNAVRELASALSKPATEFAKAEDAGGAGMPPAELKLTAIAPGVKLPESGSVSCLNTVAATFVALRSIKSDPTSLGVVVIETAKYADDLKSADERLRTFLREGATTLAKFASLPTDVADLGGLAAYRPAVEAIKTDAASIKLAIEDPIQSLTAALQPANDPDLSASIRRIVPQWPSQTEVQQFQAGWLAILGALEVPNASAVTAIQAAGLNPIKLDENVPYLGPLSAKLNALAAARVKDECGGLDRRARDFVKYPLFQVASASELKPEELRDAAALFRMLASAAQPTAALAPSTADLLRSGFKGDPAALNQIAAWAEELAAFVQDGEIQVQPCEINAYRDGERNFIYWSHPLKSNRPRLAPNKDVQNESVGLAMANPARWLNRSFDLFNEQDGGAAVGASGTVSFWKPLALAIESKGTQTVDLPGGTKFLVYARVSKGKLTGSPLAAELINKALSGR